MNETGRPSYVLQMIKGAILAGLLGGAAMFYDPELLQKLVTFVLQYVK